jgi:hypothetical protein
MMREDIEDHKVRDEIPESVTKIEVITGHNFDASSLKIDEDVPATKEFRIYKYKNPKTQRFVKILKCEHFSCGMFFRKWHNFFDHLRVHTKERPFTCRYPSCKQAFTQKANLNKHLEVHRKKKRDYCRQCRRYFLNNIHVSHSCMPFKVILFQI